LYSDYKQHLPSKRQSVKGSIMFAPVCARLLTLTLSLSVALALPLSATLSVAAEQLDQDGAPVDIHGGTVTFDVATNVPAISVHGKSTALEGHARVRQTEQGLAIEQVDATVAIASLGTGMSLRDTHMRKYVFTAADGPTPDVRFTADQVSCVRAGAGNGGREMSCQAAGTLAIRGTARPFAMVLRVRESSGGTFRAAGDAEVKLSAYQIERPSQLGVQTADDVKLHIEFTGKAGANLTTAAYRGGR
jgi:polyisoprenoid-binding protein YceI